MIEAAMLSDSRAATAAILAEAKVREGGRRERVLQEHDVALFLATVRRYPDAKVRVYADRGAFVANKYNYRAPITVLEYWPATADAPAGVVVSEADAKRPHGRGPWATVNGRKEV